MVIVERAIGRVEIELRVCVHVRVEARSRRRVVTGLRLEEQRGVHVGARNAKLLRQAGIGLASGAEGITAAVAADDRVRTALVLDELDVVTVRPAGT